MKRSSARARHASGLFDELIVDNFAGGGGASLGIERAMGRAVDVSINHDREAVALHRANHPATIHHCEDVWSVDPVEATGGRPVGLAWFSPDCKHFSRAKGGKPVEKKIRGLAWVVVRWAAKVRPRVIMLENVREFETWGPLVQAKDADGRHLWRVVTVDGKRRLPGFRTSPADENLARIGMKTEPVMVPCPLRKGQTFRRWLGQLRGLGYEVEWKTLDAADFGAPTHRRRLFLVARRDGVPIAWPEPTHGPGRAAPYRTAAECIDWSLPCPSIFLTREEGRAIGVNRPLAEKTMRRIAMGLKRFVIDNPSPFIVRVDHGGDHFRGQSAGRPLSTVTGSHGFGVVSPCVVGVGGRMGQSPATGMDDPVGTITAKNDRAIAVPFLTAQNGERDGQEPRATPVDAPINVITPRAGGGHPLIAPHLVRTGQYGGNGSYSNDVADPLTTVVSKSEHCIVSPHLTKFFGGVVGQRATAPAPTITAIDHTGLVTAALAPSLVQFNQEKGDEVRGKPLADPLNTIPRANRFGLAAASLIKMNHGDKQAFDVGEPLRTVVAGANHHGLVKAFLSKYYGNGEGQLLDEPLHTVTARDRFGLVTVAGVPYEIADIGLRMLRPRELYLAQGFPDDYRIDLTIDGKKLSIAAQVRMCGNSVSPPVAEALVRANMNAVEAWPTLGKEVVAS